MMRAKGFSLIELMVAVLMTAVIIEGFFQLFFANLSSAKQHEVRATAQRTAQRALFLINDDLRKAAAGSHTITGPDDYEVVQAANIDNQFNLSTITATQLRCKMECSGNEQCTAISWPRGVSATTSSSCTLKKAGYDIKVSDWNYDLYIRPPSLIVASGLCSNIACTRENSGENNSDVITIVFNPENSRDCANNPVNNGMLTANRYYIVKGATSTTNALFCRGFNPVNGAPWGEAQELVSGIDSLQVLYAYADNGGSVTSYRTAADVQNWWQVKGVQLGLLVNGGEQWGKNVDRQRSVSLMGNEFIHDDRISRYAFTTVQSFYTNMDDFLWRDKVFYEQ
ncbi:hypothetical protein CI610_01963 [invertebrate metagenome]|uniref:Prepilin-type N-terminal cleavage/methylation domain-containing protein n=1 Tax=invertebrate metagenome TaxID=1711999 RepID=A0A2H9T786_9ZZZZ